MRMTTVCGVCGSHAITYIGDDMCFCEHCRKETEARDIIIQSPYERRRAAVYATGNRWAIENFNATH